MIDLVGWLLILFVGTQQRRIGIKSFLRINDYPQRLIIDLDGGGAIRGGIAAVRHDKGDFLHLKMHTIQCQHRFGVSGEGRHPGQTGSIQVFARNDCYHPGYLHCLANIDVLDERMGIGTAHNVTIEHAWQLHVIHIVTLPANKASIFLALVCFS